MTKITITNLLKCGFIQGNKNLAYKNITIYDSELCGEIEYNISIHYEKRKWYLVINNNKERLFNLDQLLIKFPELQFNDKLGFVYLMKSKYGYKIGKSSQIHNRLKLFNVKLPFKWKIVDYIMTQKYHILEKQLHSKFKDKLINGEWFDLSYNDIKEFK